MDNGYLGICSGLFGNATQTSVWSSQDFLDKAKPCQE